jgi:hypothetical protein
MAILERVQAKRGTIRTAAGHGRVKMTVVPRGDLSLAQKGFCYMVTAWSHNKARPESHRGDDVPTVGNDDRTIIRTPMTFVP